MATKQFGDMFEADDDIISAIADSGDPNTQQVVKKTTIEEYANGAPSTATPAPSVLTTPKYNYGSEMPNLENVGSATTYGEAFGTSNNFNSEGKAIGPMAKAAEMAGIKKFNADTPIVGNEKVMSAMNTDAYKKSVGADEASGMISRAGEITGHGNFPEASLEKYNKGIKVLTPKTPDVKSTTIGGFLGEGHSSEQAEGLAKAMGIDIADLTAEEISNKGMAIGPGSKYSENNKKLAKYMYDNNMDPNQTIANLPDAGWDKAQLTSQIQTHMSTLESAPSESEVSALKGMFNENYKDLKEARETMKELSPKMSNQSVLTGDEIEKFNKAKETLEGFDSVLDTAKESGIDTSKTLNGIDGYKEYGTAKGYGHSNYELTGEVGSQYFKKVEAEKVSVAESLKKVNEVGPVANAKMEGGYADYLKQNDVKFGVEKLDNLVELAKKGVDLDDDAKSIVEAATKVKASGVGADSSAVSNLYSAVNSYDGDYSKVTKDQLNLFGENKNGGMSASVVDGKMVVSQEQRDTLKGILSEEQLKDKNISKFIENGEITGDLDINSLNSKMIQHKDVTDNLDAYNAKYGTKHTKLEDLKGDFEKGIENTKFGTDEGNKNLKGVLGKITGDDFKIDDKEIDALAGKISAGTKMDGYTPKEVQAISRAGNLSSAHMIDDVINGMSEDQLDTILKNNGASLTKDGGLTKNETVLGKIDRGQKNAEIISNNKQKEIDKALYEKSQKSEAEAKAKRESQYRSELDEAKKLDEVNSIKLEETKKRNAEIIDKLSPETKGVERPEDIIKSPQNKIQQDKWMEERFQIESDYKNGKIDDHLYKQAQKQIDSKYGSFNDETGVFVHTKTDTRNNSMETTTTPPKTPASPEEQWMEKQFELENDRRKGVIKDDEYIKRKVEIEESLGYIDDESGKFVSTAPKPVTTAVAIREEASQVLDEDIGKSISKSKNGPVNLTTDEKINEVKKILGIAEDSGDYNYGKGFTAKTLDDKDSINKVIKSLDGDNGNEFINSIFDVSADKGAFTNQAEFMEMYKNNPEEAMKILGERIEMAGKGNLDKAITNKNLKGALENAEMNLGEQGEKILDADPTNKGNVLDSFKKKVSNLLKNNADEIDTSKLGGAAEDVAKKANKLKKVSDPSSLGKAGKLLKGGTGKVAAMMAVGAAVGIGAGMVSSAQEERQRKDQQLAQLMSAQNSHARGLY